MATPSRSTIVLRTIGRCIYCGRNDVVLSDEHIVPLGLDGQWVLEEASCLTCAGVTSGVERKVLRGAAGALRAGLGLPTRRPKERVTTSPVRVVRGGVETTIDVPLTDYVPRFYFPVLAPPAALSGGTRTGVQIIRIRHVELARGEPHARTMRLQELAGALGAESISQSLTYEPVAFARLLAKAAYGMAVAHLGLDAFGQVHVLPAILGAVDDAGTWVGGVESPLWPDPDHEHLHLLEVRQHGREIIVHVKLLAKFGGPEYQVLVGRLAAGVNP